MNKRDELRYQRATSVRTFGEERAVDFPLGSKAGDLFATLSQQINRLSVAMADQLPTRVDKRPLLKKLEVDVRKIAGTARAIGLEAGDTSFAVAYRLPSRPGETPLLTHIDSLRALLQDQEADSPQTLQAKASLRTRFIAYELPVDFIDALAQSADALRNANRTNQGENQEGLENTARIGNVLDETAETVSKLDAIMINKYASEPEKLHVWKKASRVEKLPKKAKPAAPEASIPTVDA